MKVVGLITEYNPLHNGHKYHIEKAKEITHADYCIAVMSGDFVQRGTPAIMDKYSRAAMALNAGVDLVLELPVCYATGSAEFFALGAVSLLDKLGIVNTLCFGSECGEISIIREIAKILWKAPDAFEEQLSSCLKQGYTYPAARMKALEFYLNQKHSSCSGLSLPNLLTTPNNILGIEYIKALYRLSSPIRPATIQRKTAGYHENRLTCPNADTDPLSNFSSNSSYDSSYNASHDLSHNSSYDASPDIVRSDIGQSAPVISSATAIRNVLQQAGSCEELFQVAYSIPEDVFDYLFRNFQRTYPITEEDFSQIIKYKLLSEDSRTLTHYADITKDLAQRMKKIPNNDLSISQLAQSLKTKNMTLTRINRALIHLLLNIRQSSLQEYGRNGYTFYARVLGIRKESSHLLREITKAGKIPILTKVSKAEEQLDSIGMQMLSEDLFAAHLYNQIVYEKYGISLPNEYRHGICIL